MSNRMLPLLYLNLGGEMMYILEQRLVAQNLGDKSSKGTLLRNRHFKATTVPVASIFYPMRRIYIFFFQC